MRAPEPALIGRFRDDLEALSRAAPRPDDPLGLAVSGGPDSLAMLLLAAAAYPGAVHAATVDHGLRPEAADEAATVGAICARLSVPHAVLGPLPGTAAAGNVQARARNLRYHALAHWAEAERLCWVAVAHQRDDVAETFLLRARRGAGVGGLAAMVPVRAIVAGSTVQLVRPLLGWPREELACVVSRAGLSAVQDPSNADPRHDRARMRALIAGAPELIPSRLALSARNLRHAEDAIGWAVRRELARVAKDGATVRFDPRDLPYEIRRRLAEHAIQEVRSASGHEVPWHAQGLDRLVAALERGEVATLAGVKAEASREEWRFTQAPPRRSH